MIFRNYCITIRNLSIIIIFVTSSSLLIVYEGGSEDPTSLLPTITTGYDADTSNSSADLNLPTAFEDNTANRHFDMSTLHEEISVDEAPSKPAKVPFFPISEDTMYIEEPNAVHLSIPQDPNMCSSPMSMDSWMVYSSNSSDDFCLSRRLDNSNSSEDTSSDIDMGSNNNLTSEISKRPRVKPSTCSGPMKRKAQKKAPTNLSTNLVDIRMIDFAHTTFTNANSDGNSHHEHTIPNIVTNTTVHHGPDSGFLMGIDSLKRLLNDILINDGDIEI